MISAHLSEGISKDQQARELLQINNQKDEQHDEERGMEGLNRHFAQGAIRRNQQCGVCELQSKVITATRRSRYTPTNMAEITHPKCQPREAEGTATLHRWGCRRTAAVEKCSALSWRCRCVPALTPCRAPSVSVDSKEMQARAARRPAHKYSQQVCLPEPQSLSTGEWITATAT